MIPKISFGNIYKVNASYLEANDILRCAQIGTLSADSLKLLYEEEETPYAFALDESEDVSYIATGKDAKKCSDAYVSAAWEAYRNTLRRLVEEKNPAVLDVEFDNITGEPISVSTNAPKSVDIIA